MTVLELLQLLSLVEQTEDLPDLDRMVLVTKLRAQLRRMEDLFCGLSFVNDRRIWST